MLKILFVGKNDPAFIGKFLQRQTSYIYLSSSGVRLKNLDGDAVFIYDTGNYFIDLHIQYDLILFKNGKFEPFPLSGCLHPQGKALIHSDNEKAERLLKRQQIPFLTIGVREGDVSISSITDDGITFFCRNQNLPDGIDGEERFIGGRYFPAGILPAITGEVVSLLCSAKKIRSSESGFPNSGSDIPQSVPSQRKNGSA